MDPARFLDEKLIPGCRSPIHLGKAVTAVEDLDRHGHEHHDRHGAHLREHRSYERSLRRYGTAEEHIDDHQAGGGRTDEEAPGGSGGARARGRIEHARRRGAAGGGAGTQH